MALKGLAFFWLAFIAFVSAQTIPQLISSNSDLSELSKLIDSFPSFSQQLSQADNFTFLAPTNNAFSRWKQSNPSRDDTQAALMYHLLHGTYPITSLTNTPRFLPSALTNASYANATGGQRVEAYNDGHAVFRSALNTTSNAVMTDIIATGGIVHTIDTVLQVPLPGVTTLAAQNLSYIIGLSGKDSFLSVSNRPFIDTLTSSSDLTYFVPNSAKALSDFNTTGMTRDQVNSWALYLAADSLVYSSDFVDGTELGTWNGAKILVTVRDGDVWINSAKVIGSDYLVANGVFHVLDDLISPWNITRPSFPATPSAPGNSSAPTSSNARSSGLSPAIKTGISVGAVGLALLATAIGGLIVYLRKRKQTHKEGQAPKPPGEEWIWKPAGELDGDTLHELPQAEVRQTPVELSAGYEENPAWDGRVKREWSPVVSSISSSGWV